MQVAQWNYQWTDPVYLPGQGVWQATGNGAGNWWGYFGGNFSCQTCPGGAAAVDGLCERKDVGPCDSEESCGKEIRKGHGNPINAASGNKYQAETDYRLGDSLQLTRYYNSAPLLVPAAGNRWGAQWQGFYDRGIAMGATASTVAVQRPEGMWYVFQLISGVWTPDADVAGRLTQVGSDWRYVDPRSDNVEIYDANGVLLSISSRAGIVQTMTYSDGTGGTNGGYVLDASGNATTRVLPSGQLIRVTDSFGHTLSFGYDSILRVVKATDAAGGVYRYTYDSNANLASVVYPATPDQPSGTTRQYLYDEIANISTTDLPHALTGIVDENGDRFATFKYDAQGRGISTEHASGGVDLFSLVYNGNGTTTVTDPLGNVRTLTFQSVLGVSKATDVTQPCAGCVSAAAAVGFDANGNVASRTDFNGNVTTYSYDLARNLETSRTEAHGSSKARTIATTWHTSFRLPTQIDEYAGETATGTPLRTTAMTYDTAGNLLTRTVSDPARSLSRTWTYSNYASFGRPQTINGPRTDVSDVTTIAYYSIVSGDAKSGQIHTVTDALNHVTSFDSYDANGNVTSITDANGVQTSLVYDARQRLTSRTISSATTRYTYDGVGQVKKVFLPDNSGATGSLSYTYDAAHRLTDVTDFAGNHIHYTLDAIGNRTSENVYDASNVLKKTSSQVINSLGRLSELHGANSQVVTFGYDSNGNRTSETAASSYTTGYALDALNRMYQITDAASGVTSFTLNALDQQTDVTAPNNAATHYTLNAFGDVLTEVSPDRGTTSYTYDSAGNRITKTDARSIAVSYTYDALNRLTVADFPGTAKDQTYSYDGTNYSGSAANAIGRLTGISDSVSTSVYTYNPRGTLASQVVTAASHAYTTSYGYDIADRMTSMTYPTGRVVNYVRDYLGNVSSVSMTMGATSTTLRSNLTYLPFGPWASATVGNGLSASRGYDQDYRLSSLQVGSIISLTYGYDGRDNISAINNLITSSKSQTLGYDALSRLSSSQTSSASASWGYDANGNRTSAVNGATSIGYNYTTNTNRLTGTTGSSVQSYGYDAAGNATSIGAATFGYDNPGRMVQAIVGGATISFTYNPIGQRVSKSSGGTTTVYQYDQSGNLIAESTTAGVLKRDYIWLDDQPIAIVDPNEVVYYAHANHINAPISFTNAAQIVVWAGDYANFGSVTTTTSLITQNLRFPGQYADSETGLYQNGWRSYAPSTGRYVQSDPIGLIGGLNTYGYAAQNPLTNIDPSGLLLGPAAIAAAEGLFTTLGGAIILRGFNDPDCKCRDVQAEIDGLVGELRERYVQALADKLELFTKRPFGRMSWFGHQFFYEKRQLDLLDAIRRAQAMGCPYNPEADAWVRRAFPDKPVRWLSGPK